MFEEDNNVLNSLSPRKKACLRQCKLLRAKIDEDGGCPCDLFEECWFQEIKEEIWFEDSLRYYKDLATE